MLPMWYGEKKRCLKISFREIRYVYFFIDQKCIIMNGEEKK